MARKPGDRLGSVRRRQRIAAAAASFLWCLGLSGPTSAGDDYEGDDPGECTDRADNDKDGKFDCDDPGCAGSPDCKSPTLEPSGSEVPPPAAADDRGADRRDSFDPRNHRIRLVSPRPILNDSYFAVGENERAFTYSEVEVLLDAYHLSRATLRKGRDGQVGAGVFGGFSAALGAVALFTSIAGSAEGNWVALVAAAVMAGTSFVFGVTIALPVGATAALAPDRAIERYNRALDRGRFVPAAPAPEGRD